MAEKSNDPIDKWFDRFNKYGFPLGALGFLVFCFCIVAVWGSHHADRVINRHVQYLDSSQKTQDELAKTQADLAKTQAGQAMSIQHVESTTDRTIELVRDIHGHLMKRGGQVIGQQGPRISLPEDTTECDSSTNATTTKTP